MATRYSLRIQNYETGEEYLVSTLKKGTTLIGALHAYIEHKSGYPETVATLSLWGREPGRGRLPYKIA